MRGDISALSDQSHLQRISKADAARIKVDLNGPGLTGFGIKLQIGEAAVGDDQGVASLEYFLRWGGAEQGDSSGGQWMIIRHDAFPQKRLHDRSPERFREWENFRLRAQAAASCQDRDLGLGINDGGDTFDHGLGG